jgi:hypothetical protein
VLQTNKKSGQGSRFPLFCWESESKQGKRKLIVGPSFVVLVLGLAAVLTGKVAVGTLLGAGAGLTGLVGWLMRGRI